MPSYLCPGVYVEEVSSGSKPIGSVATAVAAIIGNTYGGKAKEPTFISSFKEYVNAFGPIACSSDAVGHYIEAFFNNGGGSAYVVSANAVTKPSGSLLGVEDSDGNTPELIHFEVDQYAPLTAAISFSLLITDTSEIQLTIGDSGTPVVLDSTSAFTFEKDLNDNLEASGVEAKLLFKDMSVLEAVLTDEATAVSVSGGTAEISGAELTAAAKLSLEKVEEIDAVTMILLPEFSLSGSALASNAVYTAAIAQCEKLKDRMVLIDPPKGIELGGESELPINSSYAALYYPWVENAAKVKVAPSAFAAGMWGKIDGRRGVWKAPAGLETGLLGVQKFEKDVNNAKQDLLNPKGINVLRKMNGAPVVWGARTLATQANPEWRYIPVRRTFMMVEESVQEGIQWAVFEPNSMNLWQALKLNIESFLNGLWRAGAFQGATADQAYFVRCGLGSTMTQGEIDEGKVIIEMGFAPLKPAEFVIVRIQQKVGQV